jgi:hypothetical protein
VSPTTVVVLIALVAFLLGAAAPVVFGRPEEERKPATVIGWVVRGLVGAAVAHTAVGVYAAVQTARHGHDVGGILFSNTVRAIFDYGGVLLALAALLHVLDARQVERG